MMKKQRQKTGKLVAQQTQIMVQTVTNKRSQPKSTPIASFHYAMGGALRLLRKRYAVE